MQAPPLRRLGLAAILAIVLLGVVIAIVHEHAGPRAGRPVNQLTRENGMVIVTDDSPLMKRLHVDTVKTSVLAHGLRVPGTVQAEPRRSINILTPVTGHVVRTDLQPGQIVHKGDVLAVLASGDLDQAYADLLKARAQETYQERVVKRAQDVLAIGGNARKDLDSASNDLAQARAERQRAERRLESLNSRTDQDGEGLVRLVAPVDGLIASTTLAPGVNITDATAVQAVLLDLAQVQIDAEIPEESLGMVTVGQQMTAQMIALPGRHCTAPIQSVDPQLHNDTRRMVAHILCDNADGMLRPNMFADVEIAVQQPDMVIIPKTALLMNNDRLTVFVQDGAPMHFRRRPVTVSYDEGETVRVLSGLQSGEHIVTRGAILLNDND
ncbi:efflux RND transporter periplasmic adaptor subunit [Asaia lannensis]|uniref:Efflux RND transporter periplasmic adaptor subunit n=1 Tax=Asaia lannensis NBRC 102526 TaxID=1307926 RepID=A0ABT1CH86_9PROT|nr:efflux RND transporter periplasmic adaptor subunit [Asaia lannensis]MCO6160233.1 efflux RND transporter periplasmic adaptor subunit [Asaia lannensis NBRC 102526]GBQ94728.1 cation efflux system protein CzcB [Asaia lannensis NBRC 102526]